MKDRKMLGNKGVQKEMMYRRTEGVTEKRRYKRFNV